MLPAAARRAEFNGLVLKIERERVVQAHMFTLLAATTERIDALTGDLERTRRSMRRSKRPARR